MVPDDLAIGWGPLWVLGGLLIVAWFTRQRLGIWLRRRVWLYNKTQGPGGHLMSTYRRKRKRP